MNKIRNRILKIEEINNIKNQKPIVVVVLKNDETTSEAKARHIKENPEDKNAKIFIFDNIYRKSDN